VEGHAACVKPARQAGHLDLWARSAAASHCEKVCGMGWWRQLSKQLTHRQERRHVDTPSGLEAQHLPRRAVAGAGAAGLPHGWLVLVWVVGSQQQQWRGRRLHGLHSPLVDQSARGQA
jgi:hypothetical protein